MKMKARDIPIQAEMPEGRFGSVEWGGMSVEHGIFTGHRDPAPLFKGLPDDRCQCPHWGYVLKGEVRYRFADRDEVYSGGDVYYVPPGHTPVLEPGTEYVEFSPADALAETVAVVERNIAAMEPAG
jgi:hypothetical protein